MKAAIANECGCVREVVGQVEKTSCEDKDCSSIIQSFGFWTWPHQLTKKALVGKHHTICGLLKRLHMLQIWATSGGSCWKTYNLPKLYQSDRQSQGHTTSVHRMSTPTPYVTVTKVSRQKLRIKKKSSYLNHFLVNVKLSRDLFKVGNSGHIFYIVPRNRYN